MPPGGLDIAMFWTMLRRCAIHCILNEINSSWHLNQLSTVHNQDNRSMGYVMGYEFPVFHLYQLEVMVQEEATSNSPEATSNSPGCWTSHAQQRGYLLPQRQRNTSVFWCPEPNGCYGNTQESTKKVDVGTLGTCLNIEKLVDFMKVKNRFPS